MEKLINWFSTKTGKKFIFGSVCFLGFGSFSINLLPQTLFIEKSKEIVQCYRNGSPVKVEKKIIKILDQVMNELEVPKENQVRIKPFTVLGFDLFGFGSSITPFGACLGIPTSFYYSTIKDIDRKNIKVQHESVNWNSDEGQLLGESLVLSDNAKKYAIASKIYLINSPQIFLNSFYPVFSIMGAYSSAHYLNKKYKLFNKNIIIRGISYSLISLFFYGYYIFLKDFTNSYYELETDKNIAKINNEYLEGGIEFLSKNLQRNIALRTLLGSDGEKYYSSFGNESRYFRIKRLPLTFRKAHLEKMKENIN